MLGGHPEKAHRGAVYMEQPAVFSPLAAAVRPVPPCPRPVGSTGPRHGTSSPLRPPHPLFLFTSAQHRTSIPHEEGRVATSAWRYKHNFDFCFLISLLFIWPVFLSFSCLHLDASAEDDDVTSQLERLWQEVNSLKEMQALQTGTK